MAKVRELLQLPLVSVNPVCAKDKLDKAADSIGRFKPTFNNEQEAEFVIYCKKMDERYIGLTINDLRRLAYEYASVNNIDNRFDQSSKMAGRDWVECFLKRHPELVIRQSAATSLARAMGFNKVQVDRFYKNLKELYEKYKFKPSRIYNVDEKGMSTVSKKTPKVVTTKGKKVVSKVVSAERGVTVTAICCMSANGHYIPPALIYPRKRPRDDLLDEGPSQSICMVSDSGFVNTELFVNWLHHFKYFVHPTKEDPVLLIFDNHLSHISLEAVKYARENNIVMLTLPPHGSHKLQPLDRCLYSPLKVKYSIECDKFMSQHPGRAITQYHGARLFNEAYKKVATLGNAESGFKVTGIYLYDDDLFDEADFAPSLVTDQTPQDVQQASNQSMSINQPESNIFETEAREEPFNESENQPEEETANIQIVPNEDDIYSMVDEIPNNACEDDFLRETPSPSILDPVIAKSTAEAPSMNIVCENLCIENRHHEDEVMNSLRIPPLDVPTVEVSSTTNQSNNSFIEKARSPADHILNEKSTSSKYVPISELSPLPRMKEKRRGGKASMSSQVITYSPYKQQLEEKKYQEEASKRKVPVLSLTAPAKNKAQVSTEKKKEKLTKIDRSLVPLRQKKGITTVHFV